MTKNAKSTQFDLVVIGAGSGGLAAAKRAASYGKKVAIIEADRTGGTCVIRGCVPKKIMSYAASTADTIADAHGYGFDVKSSFDFGAFAKKRNAEVARLEEMHKTKLSDTGITLFNGKGSLNPDDTHQVLVERDDGNKTLSAEYIILATGGKPSVPPVPGHEHAITSDGVFDLTELPKDIAIVGGGYIGIEFASIFNALGSNVHLVVRRKTMLAGFDDDIRHALSDELARRGIDFQCICNVEKIERLENGRLKTTLDNGNVCEVDQVLMATGRKPNTDGLGLEKAGLKLDKAGAVQVDKTLKAEGSHSHIYAIGDLTNRVNLTPVAIRDGRMVVDNLFNGGNGKVDDNTIPTAVFSIPQVGTVGMTQAQAEAKFGKDNVNIMRAKFRPMVNTLPDRDEKMLIKAITEKKTGLLLGAHLMGRDSAEMVQFIAMAMHAGVTYAHMQATMPLHPSSAEEFVLLN